MQTTFKGHYLTRDATSERTCAVVSVCRYTLGDYRHFIPDRNIVFENFQRELEKPRMIVTKLDSVLSMHRMDAKSVLYDSPTSFARYCVQLAGFERAITH